MYCIRSSESLQVYRNYCHTNKKITDARKVKINFSLKRSPFNGFRPFTLQLLVHRHVFLGENISENFRRDEDSPSERKLLWFSHTDYDGSDQASDRAGKHGKAENGLP